MRYDGPTEGQVSGVVDAGTQVVWTRGGGRGPRYLEVERDLRRLLNENGWTSGEALPSERQLAAHLGVSRVTVRKALNLLQENGAIVRKQGSGTYTKERIEQPLTALTGFSEDMRARGVGATSQWIDRSVGYPTAEEVLSLAISPATPVARLWRVRFTDGEPVGVERATVSTTYLPRPDDVKDSLYAALDARQARPVRALQRIRAVALPVQEAEWLHVPELSPALHTQRLTYLASGTPLEFTLAYYRADRYDFVVEMKGLPQ